MPTTIWPALAACARSSWTNSKPIPATATIELHTNRPLGRWPRNAQPSNVLGIKSKANTVATTPDVMWRSAK